MPSSPKTTKMPPGDDEEAAWDNEWDDNDSVAGLETQQILDEREDEDIENEIRTNLSSKITSTLHAYKIAGFALIIVLVSFTINTVLSSVVLLANCRNLHSMFSLP